MEPPEVEIRPLRSSDIESVRILWAATEGLGVGPGDTPEGIERFLVRNPGLSLVAVEGGALVASILCGHDGRRGFIYRLAVTPEQRRKGLAAELVRRSLAALKEAGIERCLLLVQTDNEGARRFWESMGGRLRSDLVGFSIDV
ncbi:MAG TPA: GNAT family N-acetyltransferase [Candidatus Eisenbacteria bacterium]|nr:GNAT family N-acetyltransferase [Candidatus Eisenbacteria bacterium]